MEKLFVCSDVHSDYFNFKSFVNKSEGNTILIAGDLCPNSSSFAHLFETLKNDIIAVRGNCDSSYDFFNTTLDLPPLIREYPFFERKIVLSHGHRFNSPDSSTIPLNSGDIFISGHTHVAHLYINSNGIICLNPGSLTYPRGKELESYAIIEKNKITIKELDSEKIIYSLNL